MTDTKFTPGDWEVRIEQIVPTSNETCFTVVTDDFDVVSPMMGIRNEFDAGLIAAAPKLYAALCSLSTGEGLPPGTTIEGLLAKARGES